MMYLIWRLNIYIYIYIHYDFFIHTNITFLLNLQYIHISKRLQMLDHVFYKVCKTYAVGQVSVIQYIYSKVQRLRSAHC